MCNYLDSKRQAIILFIQEMRKMCELGYASFEEAEYFPKCQ